MTTANCMLKGQITLANLLCFLYFDDMTLLDVGVIAIALFFLVRGIWVGFVRQLASIAGLLLGFIIAGNYYKQFSKFLSPIVASPQAGFLITYGLLFLLVFLSVVAFGFLLKKVMTLSLLGWFDRVLGGFFGLSKAVIVATVFFMAISGMLSNPNPTLADSFFAPHLLRCSSYLLSLTRDQELHRYFLPRESATSTPVSLPIPAGKMKGRDPEKKTE